MGGARAGGEHQTDEDAQKRWEQEQAPYFEELPEETAPVKRRSLVFTQPPKVRRIVEVPMRPLVISARAESAAADAEVGRGGSSSSGVATLVGGTPRATIVGVVFERFKSLCVNWIDSAKRGQGRTDAVLSKKAFQPLGVFTLRHLGAVCVEQDRLKSLFVGEIARCMARHLQTVLGGDQVAAASGMGPACEEVEVIIARYQASAQEMVVRHQVELASKFAMDTLMAGGGTGLGSTCDLSVVFRHQDVWNSAREFARTNQLLVSTAFSSCAK
jgi:hypothetical protein